ncbi:hypothetical protein BH23GEM8_BH23GEM8_22260 [soil metagenome]
MKPRSLRTCSAAAVLSMFLAVPVSSQVQSGGLPEQSQAAVLVLGTFHFANPGLDVIQTEVADVLSASRQAEIRAVVAALARF